MAGMKNVYDDLIIINLYLLKFVILSMSYPDIPSLVWSGSTSNKKTMTIELGSLAS